MSAQSPNTITVDPKDPEQALALLTHVSRQINGTADLHDAIRTAIETLKGSIQDQRTWESVREHRGEEHIRELIRVGAREIALHGTQSEALQSILAQTEDEIETETAATANPDGTSRVILGPLGQSEAILFNCPIHGESKIPLPPAGETFTPACQKCVEASLGICATHPKKGLHAKEESCRSWIPSRSQHPAHF